MAIIVISRPDAFTAAYRDVQYVFTSDKSPPSAIYQATIDTIKEKLVTGGLGITIHYTTVRVLTPLTLAIGDIINISSTVNGLYSGDYAITSIFQPGIEFAIASAFLGNDSGGTCGF